MNVETYCGGMADTNGYWIENDRVALLIDAPAGMGGWAGARCRERKARVAGLLLTHGHWDHIADAAAIQQELGVPVWIHRESAPLLEYPEIQAAFNPFQKIDPCKPDRVLEAEVRSRLEMFHFELLLCPGHCPGSLCLHFPDEKKLFAGDVLFAGGVGRWDLPGGSKEELMSSIANKLLVLPDETRIFPGHGPSTTVGEERRMNPFLAAFRPPRQR
ncbi:MAG: MBL fold metallo-hydrolase [Verrucomicrobia bacterium]|nr:MBL fold metallo-hydrolase [Verrucomicrobiota bacterium]